MIKMISCTIYNRKTGEKKVLKSGDNKMWSSLDPEEQKWIKYLASFDNRTGLYAKYERVLNTNERKYIPRYIVVFQ